MSPPSVRLTEDEKWKFKKIFEDLSLSTVEGLYRKKFGRDFESEKKRGIKNRIIQELLNAEWTEEEKRDLVDYYLDVLRKSKPIAAYILKVGNDVTWETIENIVAENKADLSVDPIVKGFVIDDQDEFRFSYWYPYFHGFFTDTGKYVRVVYPVSIPFRLDNRRNLLYIEDSVPYKFTKSVSLLKDPLSLQSVIEDEISEEINEKFREFINNIRAILILKQAINAQSGAGTVIRRRVPPHNSEDQVINVDELVRREFIHKLQEMRNEERDFYLSLIGLSSHEKSLDDLVSYLQALPLPLVVRVKEVFSIKDVDLDVGEIELEDIEDEELRKKLVGIDDLLRIKLKGDRDIFENETVKTYINAGGRIAGIYGTLHYRLGVYEFSLKHGVGFNTQAIPGYIKVKRQGKEIIETDEERQELEEVFNLLLSLYLHIFVS